MTETAAERARAGTEEAVIVVSGLPRSGTSVMMQMLDAGGVPVLTDNIRTADVDNPKGYYEFEAVKELPDNTAWLTGAEGKAVKMVYRLLYDLPKDHEYKVVFMLRTLSEVIRSQDAMLDRLGKPKVGVAPDRLEEIYRTQLDETKRWLAEQPCFDVLYIQYQDVIDHPDRVVSDLNHFLGGHLDTAAMERVPDRTLYRQKKQQ